MTRRLYLIILAALMAVTGFAQEQPQTGDMIYVYLKGGDILPFQRAEITEFNYGFEDEEGVTHDQPVMQWIVLADSICKVPLANIDSISFVTPPTVLQPGVSDLTASLADYVVDSKELTLYLSGSTPESLLPAIGSRVVLAERSFAGDVASITREGDLIVVTATMVDLEEIFETYYATNFIDFEEDGTATVRNGARATTRGIKYEKKINLPAIGFELPSELVNIILPLDDDIPVEGKLSAKVQPEFTIKASLVVNKGKFASVGLVGDFYYREQLALKGKIGEYSKDFKLPKDLIDIPLGETFLFFYNRWGIVFKLAAEASIDLQWDQHYRATFDWSYNSKLKQQENPTATFKRISEDFTPKGTIRGSAMIGPFTEIGVKFVMTELARAALRLEAGIELAGDYVFINKNIMDASNSTKLYEFLKAQKINLNFVVNSSIELNFLKEEKSIELPWSSSHNLVSLDLVPTFEDVSFERDGNNGVATAKISGNCVLPMKTGFIVNDKKDNRIDTWTTDKSYWNGGSKMSHTFNGLEEDQEYVLNPKVVILGFDVKATPSTNMKSDKFPVNIINFEQTDAKYSDQKGFEYGGVGYYYKFVCTTTVELDKDAENVKDWGYIYTDFNGEDKKISCAGLGSNPYADMRYAYYFDEPRRTVILTAYVQYKGDDEIKKGGTHTYTVAYGGCPDDNHPHMIDLGLPSGTKWACCNIGASKPEEYGGYYAWGETSTKGEYSFDSYKYIISLEDNELMDLGNDIAKTGYDAATANWGSSWYMPSSEQALELRSNTTSTWTTKNGVYGQQFTGGNGGIIFMPAAGCYLSEELVLGGKGGVYWTSSSVLNDSREASTFFFDNSGCNSGEMGRAVGVSIRAVTK